jgi:uncharacterized membrane protein
MFFLGLPLRLYKLSNKSLWFDEADVVLDSVNILDSFKVLELHNPIIGYKIFVFYWRQICPYIHEWMLRLPSVIFAIAAIFFIYKLAALLFNKDVGIISSFLLSISPVHIYYSQEAVAYSFLAFSTIVTVYCLMRFTRDGHPVFFYYYILLNIINIYTHPIMWFLFLIENIIVILRIKKFEGIYRKIILCNLIVVIISIPCFYSVFLGRNFLFVKNNFYFERTAGYIPLPTWKSFYLLFKNLTIGYNAPDFIYPAGIFLFLILFLKGVGQLIKRENGIIVLLVTLLPPFMVFFIARVTSISYYLDRYFVPLAPFFYIIIAFAIWKFNEKNIKILLIASTLVLSTISLGNYYRDILPFDVIAVPTKKEIREAAAYINQSLEKKDMILHTCRNTALPFEYYFDFYFNKTQDVFKDYPERKTNKQYIIFCQKLENSMQLYKYMMRDKNLQSEYVPVDNYEINNGRVFLVFSSWKFDDSSIPEIYALQWLEKKYTMETKKNFNGISVYLFTKRDI